MKVICINDRGWCNDLGCTTGPSYEEICEVEGTLNDPIDGPCFYLSGYNDIDFDGDRESFVVYEFRELNEDYKKHIKGTFDEEMADIVIRVLDFCAFKGIDLESHIEAKMKYNSLREYKHGKKY